ncbi:MAG TPA: GAF domain-containing protein [Vicinamibacteria bacterium]|nr:GAF domain-containing protein [Vicinamibacteria bacterium]
MISPFARSLQQVAAFLDSQRADLAQAWYLALVESDAAPESDGRKRCVEEVDRLLGGLSRGEPEELLAEDAVSASEAAQAGESLKRQAAGIRLFDRCCLPFLLRACPGARELADALLALNELGDRRLEVLLAAQEEEAGRRLVEAQEQAAQAAERARELARANEALRKSEAGSQRRADQLGLLNSVARRLASVLEPERLLQEAADTIRARMNHTFAAVVVLDHEGVLVGRWAGRQGIDRRSAGRTQGPVRGVIGRALRTKAPQVVPEVAVDPDYHADVESTRSEMVIPLLEDGEAVGAIDLQSEEPGHFGLDDVAAGETLAEFLVVALRNARLFAEARRSAAG